MDELIYQFLLQAGFPRASIVVDPTLFSPGGDSTPPDDATTYAIVDPETADRLAVIDVVGTVDGDELKLAADRVGHYARRIGGRMIQGFVIRVDPNGSSDAEQVQFYRVWPNGRIRQLTAKTFPDLDSLRVTYLLSLQRPVPTTPEIIGVDDEEDDIEKVTKSGIGALSAVPAILLLLLVGVDWYLQQTRGTGLLNIVQALLVTGSAALWTLVSVRRRGD